MLTALWIKSLVFWLPKAEKFDDHWVSQDILLLNSALTIGTGIFFEMNPSATDTVVALVPGTTVFTVHLWLSSAESLKKKLNILWIAATSFSTIYPWITTLTSLGHSLFNLCSDSILHLCTRQPSSANPHLRNISPRKSLPTAQSWVTKTTETSNSMLISTVR